MGSYQFKGRSRFGLKSKEILTILILDAYFCVLSSFFFVNGRKTYVFLEFCCEHLFRNKIENYESLMQFPNVWVSRI